MSATLAGTIAAGTPGIIQVSAASYSENADYIFEVLTKKLGYSEAAACGIMANIRCESTFNPHAWNAGGGSYGLCQWTGGRYGRLRSWCGSNGYDYTTIDGQLAYLEYELQSHYRGVEEYLRSVENTSDGAYDAGQYYCYHFEAPASRGSVSVYRGGLASGTFWETYRPAEWYQENGVWHYIKRDGTYHTSWLTIDNKTYYLDQNGNRISGWKTIDGNRYYFDADGVMATGWVKIDGKNYFFEEDGQLVTGLVMNSESWYMLDESGNIQASEEMGHFAGLWNENNKDQALASADQQNEGNKTASAAETADTSTSAEEGDPVSIAAMTPAYKEERIEPLAGFYGLNTPQAALASALPSLTASDASAAQAVNKDKNAVTVSALTIEESEDAATAETIEITEKAVEAASTETTDTTEKAVEAASTETTDTTEKAEETAADSTDTGANTVESADTAVSAHTEESVAGIAETAEKAEEAPESPSTAKIAQAATEVTQDTQKSVEKEQEASEADQAENASIGAINAASDVESPEIAAPAAEQKTDLAGLAFSGDFLKKYSSQEATDEIIGGAADDFTAAEALRAAAQATDEEAEEAENTDGFFMIYEPGVTETTGESPLAQSGSTESVVTSILPQVSGVAATAETAESEEAADADSSEKADIAKTEDADKVRITLSDTIPFMSLEQMDDIVKILDQQDLLQAETKDGKDITEQVKATYERIDPRGNAYNVIFTVTYQGKTTTLESVAYVNN